MSSDEKPAKIILSLENCIIPAERLQQTPSQRDGLSTEDEMDLRLLSCEMIQHAGILLRLPQVAMATAQVIFQRFFYRKSFVKHSYEHIAMACLFMAAKIEEAPRRIRDVINVFHHIKQFKTGRSFEAMGYTGNSYFLAKNGIIKEERRVLKELGFSCHVKHPHKLITTYLQILEHEKHQKLVQRAWNYMNDSLRSNVFARFPIETIACACIHLAALKLKVQLPTNPPWYWLFDASLDDIQRSLSELDDAIAKAKKSASTLANASNSNVNSPANLLHPPSPASHSTNLSSVNSPATAMAVPRKPSSSLSANNHDSPATNSAAPNSAPASGSPHKTSDLNQRSPSPANHQSSGSASSSNSSSGSSSSSGSGSDSSPENHKAHSADGRRNHSPENHVTDRQRSRRSRQQRSPSPERRRSRSPHRRQRSRSPAERHRSRSPRRRRSKSPERRRSPHRSRQNGSPRRRDRETGGQRWGRDRYSRDSRFSSHGDRHRDR